MISERSDDRDLMNALGQSGSEPAFRILYRRHSPMLYLLALRLSGGDLAQAEDALQETWIRAVTGRVGFAWRSGLRTWLAGILVNCTRQLSRAARRVPTASSAHLLLSDSIPVVGVADRQLEHLPDRLDLEQAIRRLPEGCRQVLVLHDVEGFTHDEIGRLLDIEAGTSKSQLSHARRRLRAALGTPAREKVP